MKLTPEELARDTKTVTTLVEPSYSGIEELMEEYAALCAKHPLRGVLTAKDCGEGTEATLATVESQYNFYDAKGVQPFVIARTALPAILEMSLTGHLEDPPAGSFLVWPGELF